MVVYRWLRQWDGSWGTEWCSLLARAGRDRRRKSTWSERSYFNSVILFEDCFVVGPVSVDKKRIYRPQPIRY